MLNFDRSHSAITDNGNDFIGYSLILTSNYYSLAMREYFFAALLREFLLTKICVKYARGSLKSERLETCKFMNLTQSIDALNCVVALTSWLRGQRCNLLLMVGKKFSLWSSKMINCPPPYQPELLRPVVVEFLPWTRRARAWANWTIDEDVKLRNNLQVC